MMLEGCYPRDVLRVMLNLSEAELSGQAFVRLGMPGIMQVVSCPCQCNNPFNPFEPFGGL